MAPNCAAAGASPAAPGGRRRHHAGVERHQRLGQQFLPARLRPLPHDHERRPRAPRRRGRRPRSGQSSWPAVRRIPAPRAGPSRARCPSDGAVRCASYLPCLSAAARPMAARRPDGVPGQIRTAGLALRRRALYPTELRGRRPYSSASPDIRPMRSPRSILQDRLDAVARELGAARQEPQLDQEHQAHAGRPPRSLTSLAAAAAVPPVASTSSTISMRCPLPMASRWISRASVPYSSA